MINYDYKWFSTISKKKEYKKFLGCKKNSIGFFANFFYLCALMLQNLMYINMKKFSYVGNLIFCFTNFWFAGFVRMKFLWWNLYYRWSIWGMYAWEI